MTPSFSRDTFPPQGWIYYQAQTGWSPPTPKSSTFSQTVQLIIKHRQQNPAMVVRHKLSLDPASVANELELFTRLRIGAPLPQPTPTTFPSGYTALSAGVGDIKKLATGAGILMAWDASGEAAVAGDVANKRASTCTDCPLNSGEKLTQWSSIPVAMSLKSRLSRIEKMSLKTPSDSKLGLCDGIYSPAAMLVHAPLAIINRKLKSDMRSNLHEGCWITKGE